MKKFLLPIFVFAFVVLLLSFVQLKVKNPMLLLERFFLGGGWIEIPLIGLYGALIAYKMENPQLVPKWRKKIWTIFSIVFFSQFILGISGFEKFLMTGKLHLPIPAMILSGPIYRGQISFMTILFLSTIILSGSAWCSHLCYFGAVDNQLASGKTGKKSFQNKLLIKNILMILIVFMTILLRIFNTNKDLTTYIAIGFGIIGLFIIIILSFKKKKMFHCIFYCPIGTLVNYLKYLNPFRMYIDKSCTLCFGCTSACKYDALNMENIKNKKPGITCTYCGDCLASCDYNSIQYKFFLLPSNHARNIFLFITISLHSVFLALARI